MFNNACVSFFDAAHALTYWGARAYIGTLTKVFDKDAIGVADRFFAAACAGEETAVALWEAQKAVYEHAEDRTYVHVGVHGTRATSP